MVSEPAVRAEVHNTRGTDTSKALVRNDDVGDNASVDKLWQKPEIGHLGLLPELWQALVKIALLLLLDSDGGRGGGDRRAVTATASTAHRANDIVVKTACARKRVLTSHFRLPSLPSRPSRLVSLCFRRRISTAAARTGSPLTAVCRGDVIVQAIGPAAGDSAHAALDGRIGGVVVVANVVVACGAGGERRATQAAEGVFGAVQGSEVVAKPLHRPKRPSALRALERWQPGVLGERVAGHVRQLMHATHWTHVRRHGPQGGGRWSRRARLRRLHFPRHVEFKRDRRGGVGRERGGSSDTRER
jgi:hypothetical protein